MCYNSAMLRFFFKKNFYDGWDNVMYFFIPNLIFDVVMLVFGFIAFLVTKMPENLATLGVAIWALCALCVILCGSILALSWAETAAEIVDYGVIEFKDFFKHIKGCLKDGIIYGLVLYFVTIVAVVGTIYYLKPQVTGDQTSFVGLLAGFMFVWIALSVYAGLFWYPALRSLLHNKFGKSMKKCFVILFDNPGKCFVLGLYNVFLFLISVVLLGLAPGLAGIGLSRENSLYLLLKKYDYLSELDEAKEPLNSPKRRRIPWKEILADDFEATGTRTFKGFFMPWKELEEQGVKVVKKPKQDEEIEEDEKWRED